jgi:predicted HNH restriction endonuclease
MPIGMRWIDAEWKNHADLFDETILSIEARKLPIEHAVLKPNGRLYGYARCLMTIQDTNVSLDYTAFRSYNTNAGMRLGYSKFIYDENVAPPISHAAWKDHDAPHFEEYQIECIQRKAQLRTQEEEATTFNSFVLDANSLSNQDLQDRLPADGVTPPQRMVITSAYLRNPYVVVFALRRANGICEKCRKKAPFRRASTGEPYLEVHHIKPLSEGGADDTRNVLALCPNCHRQLHYGGINDRGRQ